jgi:hypothetical protein
MIIWIQPKGVLARKKQIELSLAHALYLFDKNKADRAHNSFA